MTRRLKQLTLLQKMLLTVFPFFGFLFFIDTFFFNTIPFDKYNQFWLILLVLMIINHVILFIRIRRINADKNVKLQFIILALSFAFYQAYYIWVLDDKYTCNLE